MAEERGLPWEVHQSTASGATLKQHWFNEKGLKTTHLLKQHAYTKIIFQDHSTYPLKAIDSTAKYASLLKGLSTAPVTTYLYSTWAYPGIAGSTIEAELNSRPIENALHSIKAQSNSEIVKVGQAFDLFRKRYPSIPLLTADHKHTSPNGSYLAACVFFAQLSGQSSQGLLRRKEGKDEKGRKLYYFIVEKEVAKKCQMIADEVVFN